MVKISTRTNKGTIAPSVRTSVNMRNMCSAEIRAEYTRQSKVANKRINAIRKSGLYSPSIANMERNGLTKFGIKNEGLTSDADIKRAYRRLMDFLDSSTSTRTGIHETLRTMRQNFNITYNGSDIEFSQRAKDIFDLYEDLRELARHGELQTTDKYDLVSDLNELYDAGLIDGETEITPELIDRLNSLALARKNKINARQSQLNFNWRVG